MAIKKGVRSSENENWPPSSFIQTNRKSKETINHRKLISTALYSSEGTFSPHNPSSQTFLLLLLSCCEVLSLAVTAEVGILEPISLS